MSLLKIAELESQLKRRDARIAELEAVQAAQIQPVAWYSEKHGDFMNHETKQDHARLNSYTHQHGKFDKPLFSHPAPVRQPLSDKEIFKLTGMGYRSPIDKQLTLSVARAIEAKITGAAHD